MASRPWENRNASERELNSDHTSAKSAKSRAIPTGELRKSHSRRDLNLIINPSPTGLKPSHPPSRLQSPSTPASRAPSVATKTSSKGGGGGGGDDDYRSMLSFQSDRYQRHSIAGLSVRDDKSLLSSPSVPSYMRTTESAKAKSRASPIPSPLGNGTPDRGSVGSAKKRLSFSSSTAGTRRHSGPPKLDSGSIKDSVNVHLEKKMSNGGGR